MNSLTMVYKENVSRDIRSMPAPRQKLTFPHISIDGNTRAVVTEGVPVQLTACEFKILYLLACYPGEILSAREIYHVVWQMDDLGRVATVLMHMTNLRKKLHEACPGHEFILTTWKKGYRFITNNAIF